MARHPRKHPHKFPLTTRWLSCRKEAGCSRQVPREFAGIDPPHQLHSHSLRETSGHTLRYDLPKNIKARSLAHACDLLSFESMVILCILRETAKHQSEFVQVLYFGPPGTKSYPPLTTDHQAEKVLENRTKCCQEKHTRAKTEPRSTF